MKQNLITFVKIFPIFFVIILLMTWGLLNGYFEQDEWGALSSTMRAQSLPWWDFFASRGVHFTPLGILFGRTLYYLFNLQAQYWYLIELIIHASVSTLVFILTVRLTNSKKIAIITGSLFLLNGRAHQAFTHLAIFSTTDMAMLFILLFFIYLNSIKEKIFSLKKIMLLFLIFLTAVSFREEGVIILPIFVAYLLSIDRSKINKKNVKYFAFFIVGILIFLFVRLFSQTLNVQQLPKYQQITGNGAEYNLVTIPLKFVVQNLIYSERIAQFFVVNTQKAYPAIEGFFSSHAPIMDAAFFYIFSLIAFVFGLWIWHVRPKQIGLYLSFLLTWLFANAFMLSFVGRHISVVEPRYLYFPSFPVLFFVSIFIYTTFTSKSRYNILNYGKKTSAVLLFAVLLLTSLLEIRAAVDHVSHSGTVKKKVLKNLHRAHPRLSKNTIFFIKCRIECYRNMELGISTKNVLPFSSGPGMNILVTYASAQNQEKEWGPFFTDFFLFHTFSEDYKKIGDRSFGYFVTKSKLEKTLQENNLSKDIVVVLEYDEKNYTFKDISKDFIKELDYR